MIYGILTAVVIGVLAYISYLRAQLEHHQTQVAILRSKAQEAEWQSQIDASMKRVKETEKTYDQAKTDFTSKYGTGDDDGTHGSGSGSTP